MAEMLRSEGVESMHRVGLRCRDGADYIAQALGILRAGACFVPMAPELTASERDELTSVLSLDFVIHAESDSEWSVARLDTPTPSWQESFISLNPALIRFSSGTTGRSKGVVLSHETLRERIEAANSGLMIGPEDRVLWVLSMSHHFAVSILLYLWNGATIVFPASSLAGDILKAATEHRATVIYAAPFHYELLAADEGRTRWPDLRMAISTTASLPPPTAAAFHRAFGVHPAQALGIIEVGLPFLNLPHPENAPESIGRVQPAFHWELRSAQNLPMPDDESGELFLQGPGLFDAYIQPWRTREEVCENAWFRTGDVARADSEGRLHLLGRSVTGINVGGMKFFPEEVEAVLANCEGVAEARVFSHPHPVFGMIVAAEIVSSPGTQPSIRALTSFCRQHLARYKIPVDFSFVTEIFHTGSGKIRRA